VDAIATTGRCWAGNRSVVPMMALLAAMTACGPAETAVSVPGDGGPEAAARAFTSAMRSRDWNRLSSLMHSDALSDFRDMLQPVIELPEAGEFRRALFGSPNRDAIDALPNAEFFERFIGAMFSQTPAIGDMLDDADMQVIGRVMEGETAHVVSRLDMSIEGVDVSKMEVMSFKREKDEWRALLTGEVSSVAAALRNSTQGMSAQGR
jgi:hypothetical protein